MKHLPYGRFALWLIGCSIGASASAAPVAAKKDGVAVTAEAKKDSSVILQLKKGDTLEAGDREGMFWKVKTKDGKAGFVSVMSVQRQAGENAGIQGALREAALEARENGDAGESTRARSAVMGVRGLDESSETAAIGTIRPDLRAVYRMEDRVIAHKRVDKIENLVAKEIENAANGKGTSEP